MPLFSPSPNLHFILWLVGGQSFICIGYNQLEASKGYLVVLPNSFRLIKTLKNIAIGAFELLVWARSRSMKCTFFSINLCFRCFLLSLLCGFCLFVQHAENPSCSQGFPSSNNILLADSYVKCCSPSIREFYLMTF